MRWIRRLFWCRKGAHRMALHVDHATLTLIHCRDCGRKFKFSDLSVGGTIKDPPPNEHPNQCSDAAE
jgi:hypothetical protein